MNVSILTQLKKIIQAMRATGRKPMRIYCTYAQLMAIRDELRTVYKVDHISAHKMELYGIPLQIAPEGSGLWVSCTSG
jgi:hypothetical protein